jgi:hypothetical protein
METSRLLSEMRDWALKCNISAETYDNLHTFPEVSEEINRIYNSEFRVLLVARAAVPEETWYNYELLGVHGLWEQDNLDQAKRNFKKKVRAICEKVQPKSVQKDSERVDAKYGESGDSESD